MTEERGQHMWDGGVLHHVGKVRWKGTIIARVVSPGLRSEIEGAK